VIFLIIESDRYGQAVNRKGKNRQSRSPEVAPDENGAAGEVLPVDRAGRDYCVYRENSPVAWKSVKTF